MVKSGLKQTTAVKDDSFVPRVSQYRLFLFLFTSFHNLDLWST